MLLVSLDDTVLWSLEEAPGNPFVSFVIAGTMACRRLQASLGCSTDSGQNSLRRVRMIKVDPHS